ncbi:HNH endonuclease [Catenulispora sp. NF23]|uniref:YDG/SRA domain-containing protein n=1 Tax=Catenulispora pinistramenti TaxID=2705254 RepID=UPI001BA9AED5|nr:YDG/SRA domain-containing protein [Catenulispora pinistramenti]MBS2532202.1 HNH endonuclease [Catenulispora pinistramenti]
MTKTFGHIPGYPVGFTFARQRDAFDAGVHGMTDAGISGNGREGADSIVVSGGYPDDRDYGDVIIYTGHGGRDRDSRRQVADQKITSPGNAGLVRSQLEELLVRVLRGSRGNPVHSPKTGLSYDGLFRVDDHWSVQGEEGFLIWQFRMVKVDDDFAGEVGPVTSVLEDNLARTVADEVARRTTATVQRIVRSPQVVQRVKSWHKDRCQVCGMALEINGGTYSQAAHIQALGTPHNGPDVEGNVLCLCPNDHVLFDNGGIYISDDLKIIDSFTGDSIGMLRTHPQHHVGVSFLRLHRNRWPHSADQ